VSAPLTDEGWVPVVAGATTFVHRGPEGSVWISDGSSTVRVPGNLLISLARTLIAERVHGARRTAG
jgi:hypothetical protein